MHYTPRFRDLGVEASALARPGELVRVRENKRNKAGVWAAWDVHYKDPLGRKGVCRVTLIHRPNTLFV